MSLLHNDAQREPFAVASHFRDDFYAGLTARRDELFELTDALLCADGPVRTPVDLTLLAEHRRGHGALYEALNRGRIDAGRLRRTLAALPQPKAADGRLVLAVDVSNWLRPDAECSADRLFCLRSRVACQGKALIVGDQKQLPPTSFILGMCKAGGVLAGCPDTGAHGFCPLDQETLRGYQAALRLDQVPGRDQRPMSPVDASRIMGAEFALPRFKGFEVGHGIDSLPSPPFSDPSRGGYGHDRSLPS